MPADAASDLDGAFAAIRDGDLATAAHLIDRVLEVQPNHPYGLLAWGRLLQARGDVDGAVDAHEAAVRFAPIDARVHFALADSLRMRAEKESPFFRAPTWGRARLVAEQALYLAPDDEDGRRLLLDILEGQLADRESTRDDTPMDMLPHRSVRAAGSLSGERPPIVWLALLVAVVGWLFWSWISSAFTWVNVVVSVVILSVTLLGFRVWLGPRMAERRATVEF